MQQKFPVETLIAIQPQIISVSRRILWRTACAITACLVATSISRADEGGTFQFAGRTFFLTKTDVYSNRWVTSYHYPKDEPALWSELVTLTYVRGVTNPRQYFEEGHVPDRPLFGKEVKCQQDPRSGDWVIECVTRPVQSYVDERGDMHEFRWLFWNHGRMRPVPGGILILDYTLADRSGKTKIEAFEKRVAGSVRQEVSGDYAALDRVPWSQHANSGDNATWSYSDSRMRYAQLVLEGDGAIAAALIEPIVENGVARYAFQERLAGYWLRRETSIELTLALWPKSPASTELKGSGWRTAEHYYLSLPSADGSKGRSPEGLAWRIVPLPPAQASDAVPSLLVAHPPVATVDSKRGGRVDLLLHISADGRVSNPVVKNSSDGALNPETLKAVADWRFSPRRRNGQAVPSEILVPIILQPCPPAAAGSAQ